MNSRTASLLAAIATNAMLVVLFARALVDPANHIGFIYQVGIMIYAIEFMSLHSSGMLFGATPDESKNRWTAWRARIGFFLLYNLFVFGFAVVTKQWIAWAYFAASLFQKAAFARSVDTERQRTQVGAGVAVLLLSTFAVVFGASIIKDLFPLPSVVRAARPANQDGLFVSTPQTLMVWGVLYFGFMSLVEFLIFRKSNRPERSVTSEMGPGPASEELPLAGPRTPQHV